MTAAAEYHQLFNEVGQRFNVSPTLLSNMAKVESGYNPSANSPISSAGGMFQFIDSTWKQYAPKLKELGLSDSKYDPVSSTVAAALLVNDNKAYLRDKLLRDPTDVELYMAHNLGAGNAYKLIASGSDANPKEILPRQVTSNNPLFFKDAPTVGIVETKYRAHLGYNVMLDAYNLAKKFERMHEAEDNAQLQNFLQINPASVPWCAYFVNSVLEAKGIKSTREGTAKSYLNWGNPVAEGDEQRGDVVVLSRGLNWQGHVGFLASKTRNGYFIFGGNQNNKVCLKWYPKSKVLGIRRM